MTMASVGLLAGRLSPTAGEAEASMVHVKITMADGTVQTLTVPASWEDFIALLKARPEVADAVAV
jgi:hypothetical protein